MDNIQEDCYFWIDNSIPEENRTMNIMCVFCQKEKKIDAWFWQGSTKGYGPFEYTCCFCGKVIHDAPYKTKSEQSTSP